MLYLKSLILLILFFLVACGDDYDGRYCLGAATKVFCLKNDVQLTYDNDEVVGKIVNANYDGNINNTSKPINTIVPIINTSKPINTIVPIINTSKPININTIANTSNNVTVQIVPKYSPPSIYPSWLQGDYYGYLNTKDNKSYYVSHINISDNGVSISKPYENLSKVYGNNLNVVTTNGDKLEISAPGLPELVFSKITDDNINLSGRLITNGSSIDVISADLTRGIESDSILVHKCGDDYFIEDGIVGDWTIDKGYKYFIDTDGFKYKDIVNLTLTHNDIIIQGVKISDFTARCITARASSDLSRSYHQYDLVMLDDYEIIPIIIGYKVRTYLNKGVYGNIVVKDPSRPGNFKWVYVKISPNFN